jgi:hypothetical protein
MYTSMLFLHWKQIRVPLLLAVVAAFALPLLAIDGLGTPPGMDVASMDAYRVVTSVQAWQTYFPLLAFAVGVIMALSAWNWDHQGRHVYALSLPMTRWEYSLHKMLAGMTLCALPAAGLWLGAHVAVASIDLPVGLNAYPDELAGRFLFAMLLAYSVLFAMAAGTIRTTLWLVGGVIGFVVIGTIGNDVLGAYFVYFQQMHVVQSVFEWVMSGPGPFEVFSGNWSLIDV